MRYSLADRERDCATTTDTDTPHVFILALDHWRQGVSLTNLRIDVVTYCELMKRVVRQNFWPNLAFCQYASADLI